MLPNRQRGHIDGDRATTSAGESSTDKRSIGEKANKMADNAHNKNTIFSDTEESDDDAANQHQQKKTKYEIVEQMEVISNERETSDSASTQSAGAANNSTNTTKIDNLEHLPAGVLLDIFDRTDDFGLMCLAETSHRFAAVSKIFVINGKHMGGNPEIYRAQLNDIGNLVETIHINNAVGADALDANHWALELIQPHIGHIKKLSFDNCSFKSENILSQQQPLDITHLTIRLPRVRCNSRYFYYRTGNFALKIDVPKCRNLTKLELHANWEQSFSWDSLKQAIRNNPTLQSLKLFGFNTPSLSFYDIITLIADHVNGLKELALVMKSDWKRTRESDEFSRIFKSFQHLNSLTLTAEDDFILKHFGTECKGIKHLGLPNWLSYSDCFPYCDLRTFQQVESFHSFLEYTCEFSNLVKQLPNIHHLYIEPSHSTQIKFKNIFSFFNENQTLQMITIILDSKYNDADVMTFISAEFFEKFSKIAIDEPNARIEVKERGQIIGSITRNGVVWRNKLMYWTDCDKNYSSANVQLLDLANHPYDGEKSKRDVDQTNLLDKICDYVDVISLESLASVSDRSNHLVKSYVEKHSKKQGTFIITDEFHSFKYPISDELKLATFITDLNVYFINDVCFDSLAQVLRKYELLDRLSIYDKYLGQHWFKIKNLSHIVYDSPYSMGYSELIKIIEHFPQAKTIEIKNAGLFDDLKSDENDAEKFVSLEKFTFNFRGKTQMKNLKKIFKNTNVQVVPNSKNSA